MSNKRLIDAEELKATLKQWFPPFTLEGLEAKTLFKQIIHDIDNAPAVEPSQNAEHDALQYSKGYQAGFLEAKKLHGETEGEWITVKYAREDLNDPQKSKLDFVKCPFCETIHQGRHHFCSYCGARMKEGQADE